jgi:hypothetical protein
MARHSMGPGTPPISPSKIYKKLQSQNSGTKKKKTKNKMNDEIFVRRYSPFSL